jgi:hypothetical protein
VKACPFCAEQVQDAAAVCKHCGRDLNRPGAPAILASAAPKKSRASLYVLLGLLVVGGVVAVNAVSSASTTGANPLPPAMRQTIRLNLANGEAKEIGAGELYHYTFQLPDRVCAVTGRVLGVSGGNKDFYAALMSDDDYRNWTTNHEGKVFWQTDPQTAAATISASLRGPGTYHLVVSNRFSMLTAKTVEITAQVECP